MFKNLYCATKHKIIKKDTKAQGLHNWQTIILRFLNVDGSSKDYVNVLVCIAASGPVIISIRIVLICHIFSLQNTDIFMSYSLGDIFYLTVLSYL